MTQRVGQGGAITLDAEYRDGTGARVDPADPRASIYDVANTPRLVNAIPIRNALGLYQINYAVPADAALGIWRIEWSGTINGVVAQPGLDYFEVVPAGSIIPIEEVSGYPTVDELGDLMQTDLSALVDSATLAIALAFGAVQGYTRQYLLPVVNDVVTLRVRDGGDLYLPQRPVTRVESVAVGGAVIAATGYSFDRSGRLSRLYNNGATRWGRAGAEVVVTYSHGFESLPNDIRAVTMQAAARQLTNPAALRQESIAGYSATFEAGGVTLTETEHDALKRYRRRAATV